MQQAHTMDSSVHQFAGYIVFAAVKSFTEELLCTNVYCYIHQRRT